MNQDWLILLLLSLFFLALFALAELLFHVARVKAEYTRKLVHAGTGLLTLLFPCYLTELWQVAAICLAFLFLLLASMRWRFLLSIHAVERKTLGSILYPLIIILVFAYFLEMKTDPTFPSLLHYFIPVLLMAIADPAAALVGKRFQERIKGRQGKTQVGSAAFLVTAFLVTLSLLILFDVNRHWVMLAGFSMLMALVTGLTERFSGGGWDNFTIPLAAMGMMYLFCIIF